MIAALLALPLLAGGLVFALRRTTPARILLAVAAAGHLALTARCWFAPAAPPAGAWLGLDPAGRLFLAVISVLFFAVALTHLVQPRATAAPSAARPPVSEHAYLGGLLLFLATMTLATVSRHLGLLWVAIEATTLATAPLIYFHRHARALEATWKYLMICSVGIALALLGTFLVAVAAAPAAGAGAPILTVDALAARAAELNVPWLKAAFIFLLVGYGTKMGLAPLHTWLPDAHSEAPSPVSALLSGAQLNCAFLALLRAHQLCVAAGQGAFSAGLLMGLGLCSVAVAAVFLIRQPDYKRLLAYSSIEHMGLLALGVGVGGAAVFGALLHAVNHSLAKGALFLLAGWILAATGTKQAASVRGLLGSYPAAAALWLAGLFAITGAPPFGTFVSEFTILQSACRSGHTLAAAAVLALMAVAFAGMSRVFLGMAQGDPGPDRPATPRPGALALLPPAVVLAATLILGLGLPDRLRATLAAASAALGGALP